jgi:orotidine-5'-phosphate decarboxylase
MPDPIIVALDMPSPDKALALVEELSPVINTFKVGSELFTSAGPDIVRKLRAREASVFLDLKFHDIPNTVAKACAAAARLDVQMLTIHTSGGLAMMQAGVQAAQETSSQLGLESPLILGVTVLTSLNGAELGEVGQEANVGKQVDRLARLAAQAGLRGLVCSPLELAGLRQTLPEHMTLVTPGIRMTSEGGDDQKRTLTAKQAMDAGASWLVVGRPIIAAANPRQAAERILKSLTQ